MTSSVLGGEVQLAVGANGRRLELVRLRQPLLQVVRLAGLRVEGRQHAGIGEHVQDAVVQHR